MFASAAYRQGNRAVHSSIRIQPIHAILNIATMWAFVCCQIVIPNIIQRKLWDKQENSKAGISVYLESGMIVLSFCIYRPPEICFAEISSALEGKDNGLTIDRIVYALSPRGQLRAHRSRTDYERGIAGFFRGNTNDGSNGCFQSFRTVITSSFY